MSLAYAKAGASGIAISSRTMADLDKLEAEIKNIAQERGNDVAVLKSVTDVQSSSSVQDLESAVRQNFGRVDVVIANAGIISSYIEPPSNTPSHRAQSNLPVGIIEDPDWARVLDINLQGTWRISKAFLPLLQETSDGPKTIIASTSMAAHNTQSGFCPIAYNISKLAICRLIEHIHNDHGENGVRAYAMHPGAVVTPQTVGHEGEMWGQVLNDDIGLAGAWCVWLSHGVESKEWLSGRFVSCNWDVEELVGMRGVLEEGGDGMLRFRMGVPGG